MPMDEVKVAERLAALEQDMKSIHRRLDNLESLTESVHVIATEVRAMREDVNGIDSRLNEVEQRPGKRWEKVVMTLLTAAVTAVAGFFLGHFF